MSQINLEELAPLVEKYNWNVPRYTSFPPITLWHRCEDPGEWIKAIEKERSLMYKKGIAIYVHLPFCERLCTFCACNKYITTDHSHEEEYLKYLFSEIDFYYGITGRVPLKHIYYGGGTPTFFSPRNLARLNEKILSIYTPMEDAFLCYEANPNYTTVDHIKTMREYGFRRVSFGIQELDPIVAEAINRPTDMKKLETLVVEVRKNGYENLNFDIIYGLPFQTVNSIEKTIKALLAFEPDSITFYSYAHVPWKGKAQRKFTEEDLPPPMGKLSIFMRGIELLTQHGYQWLGLDHFVKKSDRLYHAWTSGKLTRNFMGYTELFSDVLLAMGTSAISMTPTAYFQNHSDLREYYRLSDIHGVAPYRFYRLNALENTLREHIISIMCYLQADISDISQEVAPTIMERLQSLEDDGLIRRKGNIIQVTRVGRFFLRVVASAFDVFYRWNFQDEPTPQYSKAI